VQRSLRKCFWDKAELKGLLREGYVLDWFMLLLRVDPTLGEDLSDFLLVR
jgi:hypothetical protein